MSIVKEKPSIMSIVGSSEESQNKHNTPDKSHCDTIESDAAAEAHNHKLSLEFRCSDTPLEQRKLCESFWKVVNQHPELDRIMARGWSEKEVAIKETPTRKKTPQSHCDDLQEFLNHKVDTLVLLGLKNMNNGCSTELKLDQSSTNIFEDLQHFDSKVQTEICIPPKTPQPPHLQQEVIIQQRASSHMAIGSSQNEMTIEGSIISK